MKITTSNFILTDKVGHREALIITIPRSIFSARNGDDRIKLTANIADSFGMHLANKTETKTVEECDSSIVNVENEGIEATLITYKAKALFCDDSPVPSKTPGLMELLLPSSYSFLAAFSWSLLCFL